MIKYISLLRFRSKKSSLNEVLLFLLFTIFSAGFLKAQNSQQWTPVLISHDGTNAYEGVEANFTLVNCGPESTVFLKLNNATGKNLKATWIYYLESKDNQKHYGTVKTVSVIIPANSEVKGDCSGTHAALKLRLSEYGLNADNFQTVVGSNFSVIPSEK